MDSIKRSLKTLLLSISFQLKQKSIVSNCARKEYGPIRFYSFRMDLDTVTGCLDYYGGMAASLAGQHVKMGGGSWAYVTREPLGVVGGIGAWNYPMQVRFVTLNTEKFYLFTDTVW